MKIPPLGLVLVNEVALHEMWQAVSKSEGTNNKAAALFHLLAGECAADESEGVTGDSKRGRLHAGINLLCQDMISELDGRYDAAHGAVAKLKMSGAAGRDGAE